MSEGAEFAVEDTGEGGQRLVLSGPYLISTIGEIDQDLRSLDGPLKAVDISAVTSIDTVGAWVARSVARQHGVEVVGGDDRANRLLRAIEPPDDGDLAAERLPIWKRVPTELGQKVIRGCQGAMSTISFLGRIMMAFGRIVRRPSTFRFRAFVRQMELVGVTALPIVGLMSFLIGIVIAQQGAVQLQQFGAEALTVNLVGRITLRELGVLMTAIMVAGRSGSAFAAQLGTMKLTEEIDAMRTIGISPVEALVIPRLLAAFFMMPLLGFYSAAVAMVGGAVVGELMLGIPFWTFLSRIQEVVPTWDLYVGLIKAPVFGIIIAMTGCYHGMQVKGNSEEVGLRTTMAVVSAIFAVIVLDAFFAVFFTEIGWG